MSESNNTLKDRLISTAMISVEILYYGWILSSLGLPLFVEAYINKLEQMKNPSRLGSGCGPLPWTMLLGPFSIPISIYYAGLKTFEYFRYSK